MDSLPGDIQLSITDFISVEDVDNVYQILLYGTYDLPGDYLVAMGYLKNNPSSPSYETNLITEWVNSNYETFISENNLVTQAINSEGEGEAYYYIEENIIKGALYEQILSSTLISGQEVGTSPFQLFASVSDIQRPVDIYYIHGWDDPYQYFYINNTETSQFEITSAIFRRKINPETTSGVLITSNKEGTIRNWSYLADTAHSYINHITKWEIVLGNEVIESHLLTEDGMPSVLFCTDLIRGDFTNGNAFLEIDNFDFSPYVSTQNVLWNHKINNIQSPKKVLSVNLTNIRKISTV